MSLYQLRAEIVRLVATSGAPKSYPELTSFTVAAVAAAIDTTPDTSNAGALKVSDSVHFDAV